jgi:RNA chaperone Hfq
MKPKRVVTPAEVQTLAKWQEESVQLKLSLINGVVLEGKLVGYDQYMLLLDGSETRAVYKHAVLRIEPEGAHARPQKTSPTTVEVRVRKRRLPGGPGAPSSGPGRRPS